MAELYTICSLLPWFFEVRISFYLRHFLIVAYPLPFHCNRQTCFVRITVMSTFRIIEDTCICKVEKCFSSLKSKLDKILYIYL